MTTSWKLKTKKAITKSMTDLVQGKGASKKRRIKACLIDILSDGDMLTTEEIHFRLDNYMIHNVPVESTVGTLLRSVPQIESLGRIRTKSIHDPAGLTSSTKPVQTWALRSLE
jgi:hypothetical protein